MDIVFEKLHNHDLHTSSKVIIKLDKFTSCKNILRQLRSYGYFATKKRFTRTIVINLEKSLPSLTFNNDYLCYDKMIVELSSVYDYDQLALRHYFHHVLVNDDSSVYYNDSYKVKTYIGLIESIFVVTGTKLALQSLQKNMLETPLTRGYLRQIIYVNNKLYLHVNLL